MKEGRTQVSFAPHLSCANLHTTIHSREMPRSSQRRRPVRYVPVHGIQECAIQIKQNGRFGGASVTIGNFFALRLALLASLRLDAPPMMPRS